MGAVPTVGAHDYLLGKYVAGKQKPQKSNLRDLRFYRRLRKASIKPKWGDV